MATLREHRAFLQKERLELINLLESIGGHPYVSMAYKSKLEEVEKQIRELPPLGQKEARTTLYFSGGPVVGSEGIDSLFASNVLSPFQNMVMEDYSSRVNGRSNGKRGKVKNANESRLLLVGLPRGSFGLELVKAENETLLDEMQLGETLAYITELVAASAKNDENFAEYLDKTDPRVINSLKDFLKVIANNKAGIRLLTGDFTCELSPRQAKSAYNRVSQTYAEKKSIRMEGIFKGALLESRKFDFNDQNGYKITGVIDHELNDTKITYFNTSFTNKKCVAVMDEYTITYKNNRKSRRYILKDLIII